MLGFMEVDEQSSIIISILSDEFQLLYLLYLMSFIKIGKLGNYFNRHVGGSVG